MATKEQRDINIKTEIEMKPKVHPSVYDMWSEFIQNNTEYKTYKTPDSFYFGDNEKDANECANLVVKGIKQATSTSLWWFEKNHEELPKIEDLYIVTNWKGIAKAIIRTIKVEEVPFNEVTKKYAKIEGEGDKSLDYWKKTHWNYYSREMQSSGEKPTENMIVICEQFKKCN